MSKIQDICIVQSEIKRLRRKLRMANHNFHCVTNPVTVVVDSFSGGAHVSDVPQKKCDVFNMNELCKKTNCKNYDWAKSYINLVTRLDKARNVRNDLLVEYFWICRKYHELKVYRNLSRQADLRRREAFHQYCETLYDADDEVAQKNDEKLKVAHDAYEAAVEQCNAARAKLFGREK